MKKNLAKRIVLGLLTGAVLMSNSVAWAEAEYGYKIELGTVQNGNYVYYNETIPKDSLSIGGYIAPPKEATPGAERSIAIGVSSVVGDEGHELYDNVALGYSATVKNVSGGTAIGSKTYANATNSTALGFSAVANAYGSVALGSGSQANKDYVVSVGSGNAGDDYATRHIINVTDLEVKDLKDSNNKYGSYAVNVNTLNAALDEVQATNDATYVKITGYGTDDEKVVISEDKGAQVTFEDNKVIFGTNSSWYEANKGFFAGGNANHDVSSAKAALKEDGGLMGASGKFIVDGNTGNLGIGDGTKATFGIEAQTGNVTANGDVYVGGALVVGSNFAVDSASGNVKANALDAAVDVFANGKSLVATANQAEANKQAIEGKADKATTLEGYGITDAYTKAEVDSKIDGGSAAIAGLNQRLEKTNAKINKVGAGAAALAALHPLDYDHDDKLTFSAGMGNYAGENAAALGAFYRPNEKFMLSLGGTMGNGENMVNLGLSIGLDKPNGFAKMSKRELIQEVNAVKAENEAMKDQLANADERIAKLEALVAQLVAK